MLCIFARKMGSVAIDDYQMKLDETVNSETSYEEVTAPAVTKTRKNCLFTGVVGGIVVLVLILGLTFGIKKPNQDPAIEPSFQEEEPSTKYQRFESIFPVKAADVFYSGEGALGQVGFIDEDGCVNVIHYDNDEVYERLCKDFGNDISSFQIKETDVIIAHGGLVEIWTTIGVADTNAATMAHTWEPLPISTTGDILNVISEPSVPGFGKKVYDIGMYLIIASDEGIFSYSKPRSPDMPWTQNHHWENAIGFDGDREQTNLAVYDDKTITIYDLSAAWWGESYEPTVHISPMEINSVAVSMHGARVYVISKSFEFNSVTMIHDLTSGQKKYFNHPHKHFDDIIYSIRSGSIFDIRSGSFLCVEVEDADDVFDIQADGICIAVLFERDGVKMVDFYKNKTWTITGRYVALLTMGNLHTYDIEYTIIRLTPKKGVPSMLSIHFKLVQYLLLEAGNNPGC